MYTDECETIALGSKPVWNVLPKAQELWRFYSKLRYRLHPYIYSAAIEAHQTGRPILAPLVYDYHQDAKTWTTDFEFMLGRDLLVAPMTSIGETQTVYLPEDMWTHYWSGKRYAGKSTVTVPAPLLGRDGLPMFVRDGAMIPMIPETNRTPSELGYLSLEHRY